MIRAAFAWPTNGHLIADVAQLYIAAEAVVLDPTYGRGAWWTRFRPANLIAHDLHTVDGVDCRALPEDDCTVDVVAFDPPYKLNGTPTPEVDGRYGVHVVATWQERHRLIRDGITEAVRVLRPDGVLLVKCQDQVCSGQVRWQTDEVSEHARTLALVKVDRFDMVGTSRPQPGGRAQVHAHGRPSTLSVFTKANHDDGLRDYFRMQLSARDTMMRTGANHVHVQHRQPRPERTRPSSGTFTPRGAGVE